MPIDFGLSVDIPKMGIFNRVQVDTATQKTLYPAMQEATLYLEREVKRRTPVGATEVARGSIQSATEMVRGRTLEVRGTVTSAQRYIVPLETGSRPHWVPIGPLKMWARSKGKDEGFAYAVRAIIHRRGTKGAHMFRDAFAASEGKLTRILRGGVEAWVRMMRG